MDGGIGILGEMETTMAGGRMQNDTVGELPRDVRQSYPTSLGLSVDSCCLLSPLETKTPPA
jgi:hypothetical protein